MIAAPNRITTLAKRANGSSMKLPLKAVCVPPVSPSTAPRIARNRAVSQVIGPDHLSPCP